MHEEVREGSGQRVDFAGLWMTDGMARGWGAIEAGMARLVCKGFGGPVFDYGTASQARSALRSDPMEGAADLRSGLRRNFAPAAPTGWPIRARRRSAVPHDAHWSVHARRS